jgi:hypothetical protein
MIINKVVLQTPVVNDKMQSLIQLDRHNYLKNNLSLKKNPLNFEKPTGLVGWVFGQL